jgi:hypothetical protein
MPGGLIHGSLRGAAIQVRAAPVHRAGSYPLTPVPTAYEGGIVATLS